MCTPMEEVLEVKTLTNSLRRVGISQANGVCAFWYLPQTHIFITVMTLSGTGKRKLAGNPSKFFEKMTFKDYANIYKNY